MKIRLLSDLHIEHGNLVQVEHAGEDVIVFAGDIYSGPNTVNVIKHDLLMDYPDDVEVIFVPGNHEFYSTTPHKEIEFKLRYDCNRYGYHYLDNDTVIIDGVRFIGSTLWSNFELYNNQDVEALTNFINSRISDFSFNNGFTASHCRENGKKSIKYIEEALEKGHIGKTVVITHFSPFIESIPKKFEGMLINAYFCNNLVHLAGKMDFWLHGHTHTSMNYMKNGTNVIANPHGYNFENPKFKCNLTIEV